MHLLFNLIRARKKAHTGKIFSRSYTNLKQQRTLTAGSARQAETRGRGDGETRGRETPG